LIRVGANMNSKYSFVYDAQALDVSGMYPDHATQFTYLSIFSVLLAILLVLLGFRIYQMTFWHVVDFTIKIPVDLPSQPIPEVQLAVFLKHAEQFFDEILKNIVPENDLIVTSDIMNGLIAQSDFLRGHMHVDLLPNWLTVKTSLPTDFLPGGKHRFFVSEHFVQVHQGPSDEYVFEDVIKLYKEPRNESTNNEFQSQWMSRPPVITSRCRMQWGTGKFGKAVDLDKIFSSLDRPLGGMRFYLWNLIFFVICIEDFLISMLIFGKGVLYRKKKDTDVLKILYNNPNTPKILHSGIERIQFEKGRMIIQPRGRSFHTKLGGGERPFLWMYSNVAIIGREESLKKHE
jgi:hypothetical protein